MKFNTKKWLLTGRAVTTLVALFMLFDGVFHLMQPPVVTAAFQQMGYSLGAIVPLAIVELICVVLYIVPRTSIFGAMLLTGYLGGAVDSNLRAGAPLFSGILFPVYVAILLWGGLYLRFEGLRNIVPLQRKNNN